MSQNPSPFQFCPVHAVALCLSPCFGVFPPSSVCWPGSWRPAKLNKGLAVQPLLDNLGRSGRSPPPPSPLWHSRAGSSEPPGTGQRLHSEHFVCTCLSFTGASPWQPRRGPPKLLSITCHGDERWPHLKNEDVMNVSVPQTFPFVLFQERLLGHDLAPL